MHPSGSNPVGGTPSDLLKGRSELFRARFVQGPAPDAADTAQSAPSLARRQGPALRRAAFAAALLAAVAVIAVVLILVTDRNRSTGADQIPPNLPAQISQDLHDLHQAVNG